MNVALRLVACVAVVWSIFSCSSGVDPQAGGGGNDFPNSALGKKVAESLSSFETWDQNLTAPAVSLDLCASGSCLSLPQAPSLGKMAKSAAQDFSVTIDYSDTATVGVVRVYSYSVNDTITTHDTLVARWFNGIDPQEWSQMLVLAAGVTRVNGTERFTSYRYLDADGDGVIGTTSSRQNSAVAIVTQGLGAGYRNSTTLVVDAGPDGSFENESDNRILEATQLSLLRSDTIMYATYRGVDNNEVVIDPQGADSNVIDVFVLYNGLSQFGSRSETRARFVVFAADSTRNYPVRWSTTEQFWNGRRTNLLVTGPRADSSFRANDTVGVLVVVEPARTEAVLVDTLYMRVVLGAQMTQQADDALLGVYAHIVRVTGTGEKELKIRLECDPPIGQTAQLVAGQFSFEIVNDSDGRELLDGTFSAREIRARYTTVALERFDVSWDRDGDLLKFEQLD